MTTTSKRRRRPCATSSCWYSYYYSRRPSSYHRYILSLLVTIVALDSLLQELRSSWMPQPHKHDHQQRNLKHHSSSSPSSSLQSHPKNEDYYSKASYPYFHSDHPNNETTTINKPTTVTREAVVIVDQGGGSSKGQENQHVRHDDDIHFSNVEILPLTDWEERSLQGLYDYAAVAASDSHKQLNHDQQKQILDSTCHPPNGIPKQCCIGTFAGMGRIIYNQRHKCSHSKTLYQMQQLQQQQQQQTGSGSGSKCSICYMLEYMKQNNYTTITFLGDSMSNQIFQGLICELYKRNYIIVNETNIRIPTKVTPRQQQQQQQQNNQQRGHGKARHHEQEPPVVVSDDYNNDSYGNDCYGINHCLHLIRTIEISSPLWNNKKSTSNFTTTKSTKQQVITLKFFHIYRLPFASPQQEELVLSSSDILVMNFGLHWGAANANYDNNDSDENPSGGSRGGITSLQNLPTPQHLQTVLLEFLYKIVNHNKKMIGSSNNSTGDRGGIIRQVLFRETSAQHFDSDGGDYSFVKKYHKKKTKNKNNNNDGIRSTTTNNNNRDQSNRTTATTKAGGGQQQQASVQPSLQCVPYQHGKTSGWRERVVKQVAKDYHHEQQQQQVKHNSSSTSIGKSLSLWSQHHDYYYPTFTILRFFEHTKVLHDLHPYDDDNVGGGADCTHYCSSPFLYSTLWKSIRDALQS